MDKIEKILRSLSAKEREAMLLLMQQLMTDYKKVPWVRPLKGMKGWFRARMGNYRILFSVDPKSKKVGIERISRRNERTYKDI